MNIDWALGKEQSHEDFLQAYCHYPLDLAEQEGEDSQKDIYKITTINWTYATDNSSGTKIVDYEHVYKNIYEKTLREFLRWYRDIEENEEVLSIEKITNII